jgi:hypothetical protein
VADGMPEPFANWSAGDSARQCVLCLALRFKGDIGDRHFAACPWPRFEAARRARREVGRGG